MWLVTDTELFCPCKKFTGQCCFRRKNLESNVTKKKKKAGGEQILYMKLRMKMGM